VKEFRITHKITAKDSLNKIYAGQHWTKRKSDADYWHLKTQQAIRLQLKKVKMFEHPVFIEFWFNSKLDADNHGALVKYIIDGMKGTLIQDDTKSCVIGYAVRFMTDDEPKTDIKVSVRVSSL